MPTGSLVKIKVNVKLSMCVPGRYMRGGGIALVILIFTVGGGEWAASCLKLLYSQGKGHHMNAVIGWVDLCALPDALETKKCLAFAQNLTKILWYLIFMLSSV